ncbi:MAG: hypothetical protein J5I93_02550, partial [Pirellulaceae bacterium]|nr:hypothetical protein [Pirellulaceae bacterium]
MMGFNRLGAWIVLWTVCLAGLAEWCGGRLGAQEELTSQSPATTGPLAQQQQQQEKARRLAGELLAAVIDVQLRQLRENGLQELPIYGEIAAMRENIEALVQQEMQQVVDLLVRAQSGTREQRLAHLEAARNTTREVVMVLAAERQKLYRRLRISRLAAQVREAIQLQSRVRETTQGLAGRPAGEREQATLLAGQDQHDVRVLYYQLVATLEDVMTWTGPVGAVAGDGLRLLGASRLAVHLANASADLRRGAFEPAAESQREVLRGLQALLELVEAGRGLISSDREQTLQLVRELIERQEQLRQQASAAELTDEQRDRLVDQQTELQRDLANLDAALEAAPESLPLLDQAKAAAGTAAERLFEDDAAQARVQQSQVLGSLAEIESQLERGLSRGLADKSAEQLAAEAQQLEQLDRRLDKLSGEQAEVVERSAEQPAEARGQQERIAAELHEAAQPDELPAAIQSRVEDARQQAAESAGQLREESPEQAADRQEAARAAADALERAIAEVKAVLADTRRRQLAVEVGELARAAEALERAAAAEREVTRQSEQAAQAKVLSPEQARSLAEQQAKVAEVAGDIARGVQRAAPEVAQQLREADQPIQAVGEQLRQAEKMAADPTAGRQAAQQAAQEGKRAAAKLEQAAGDLRRRQGEAARQLAQVVDQQLAQVAAARQAIEQSPLELPAASDLQRTEQALQRVQAARREQQRASGRAASAEAQERAESVAALRQQQQRAEQAAGRQSSGRHASPWEATLQQQKVAEAAEQLAAQAEAAQASGELTAALRQAAAAARQAAEAEFDGNRPPAAAARQEAAAALHRAADA